VFKHALGNTGGQFARQAAGARVLVQQQHLRGFPDAGADRFAVERQQRAQIHHFDRCAFFGQRCGGFERHPQHGAVVTMVRSLPSRTTLALPMGTVYSLVGRSSLMRR